MARLVHRFTVPLLMCLIVVFSGLPASATDKEPLLINQIAINPTDPGVLYAAARPQGVLKSTDHGETWRPARRGLGNTSGYHIVIDPAHPNTLYLGTFGGGIYKSQDGGDNWVETNTGLGDTNIHALILDPHHPDHLLVSTSTGELFFSENAGNSWAPFNEGLPMFEGEVIASLLVFPGDTGGYSLAQGGLYRRPFSSTNWLPVGGNIQDQVMTALAYDQQDRIFYAGTMKRGLFRATLPPAGEPADPIAAMTRLDWQPVEGPFHDQWIRFLALDPKMPSTVYVGVVAHGLFTSTDRGATWTEAGAGLPSKDIESLAIDPTSPGVLYAGMHSDGIYLSRDGGLTWAPPRQVMVEPVQQIIASLSGQPSHAPSGAVPIAVPSAFAKCNKCHGWTDPALNQRSTYWRVSPNFRNWSPTVHRMSQGAGLTPQEEHQIIAFLTTFSEQRRKEGPFVIHRIAVDPAAPQILYAVTSNYGILKSTDHGASWILSNQGLGSYTHHAVVVDPLHPDVVYVGSWSGGVSKSDDQGAHWRAVNDGLGNTAIEDLALDPTDTGNLYAATTAGVFKSPDGGVSWMPYSQGLPVTDIENFERLLALPQGPVELVLGTSQGLFLRRTGASGWVAESDGIAHEHITALASVPASRVIYAGTIKNGLWRSEDAGVDWSPMKGLLDRQWVSDIAIDPTNTSHLYVSTRGAGIFASTDGGAHWDAINDGLPVKDIRSLAVDPGHPMTVYAGTTLEGMLATTDGGRSWTPLRNYPRLTFDEIVASLTLPAPRDRATAPPSPSEFIRCNSCHGWADPTLNTKHTYWRVVPNRRNWGATVQRMSRRARLTPEEAAAITKFLTEYTHSP
ncbi:MAG TPA: hypothetical protein VML36_05775 [Nitrospiria bacterium]|nr:hypothetical protein [Nitrospiria bacterium]